MKKLLQKVGMAFAILLLLVLMPILVLILAHIFAFRWLFEISSMLEERRRKN